VRLARAARPNAHLLQLSEMRLPLIAFIDVILFILMYFLLAGSIDAEERELAAAIGGGSPVAGDDGGFTPQVVDVALEGGVETCRIGLRRAVGREALAEVLRALPKEPGVVVRVSDDVSVAGAAAALQACRDAGFERIAYRPGRAVARPAP
jgi:biopolymer transport protein ExbD